MAAGLDREEVFWWIDLSAGYLAGFKPLIYANFVRFKQTGGRTSWKGKTPKMARIVTMNRT